MSVVIDQFEVVAEPPPASGPQGAPPPPAAQAPTPRELLHLLHRQVARLARVQAS